MVLATTDVGLFRSTDGGASWHHLALSSPTASYFFFWSLAYAGNDCWLVTAQVANLAEPPAAVGSGKLSLWRSTDDGATWTWATAALPGGESTAARIGRATLATAQSTLADPASARIFLLAARVDAASVLDGAGQYDLLRSDDAGLRFQALDVNATRSPQNPDPDQLTLDVLRDQAAYNQALIVDPANPDGVLIGGQLSLIRSLDGGRTWAVLSDWLPNNSQNQFILRPYVHADLHAFAVGADGTFYAGSDGGLFVSTNAVAGNWSNVTFTSARNEGLVTHLAYSVACAPESWPAAAQGFVAGGLQDNGTRLRAGDSTTFNQILGGDGIGLAVSAATDAQGVPAIFLASVAGDIYLSRDGGQNFSRFSTGLPRLPFFVRIARETAAGDSYLTLNGTPAGFYRWRDGEAGWTDVSGTLHWQESSRDTAGFISLDGSPIGLRNLAAHPRRAGVWAAVSNRFSYMTADGGAHWLVGVQPRPSGSSGGAYLLSSIEFDPDDRLRGHVLRHRAVHRADRCAEQLLRTSSGVRARVPHAQWRAHLGIAGSAGSRKRRTAGRRRRRDQGRSQRLRDALRRHRDRPLSLARSRRDLVPIRRRVAASRRRDGSLHRARQQAARRRHLRARLLADRYRGRSRAGRSARDRRHQLRRPHRRRGPGRPPRWFRRHAGERDLPLAGGPRRHERRDRSGGPRRAAGEIWRHGREARPAAHDCPRRPARSRTGPCR